MDRKDFFRCLLGAPVAAVAAVTAKAEPAKPADMAIKIGCDTSELEAGLKRAELALQAFDRGLISLDEAIKRLGEAPISQNVVITLNGPSD